jgi:hypothetical protein
MSQCSGVAAENPDQGAGRDSGPESGLDPRPESAPDSGAGTDAANGSQPELRPTSEPEPEGPISTRAGTTDGPPSDPEPEPQPKLDEAILDDPEGVLADAGEGADRTREITDERPWDASEFGPESDD